MAAPLPPSSLFICRVCALRFRYPRADLARLNALYEAGASDTWTAGESNRADWKLAAEWIRNSASTGRVLDVGCFDGGFLASVDPGFVRMGIEIHESAARRAETHGIDIIGSDYMQLVNMHEEFDFVVSFDLIEHVHDPQRLVSILASRLRPGGRLIIGTGNAEAPTFRLMGSRYWYVWFPEHISFVSPRWCHGASAVSGLLVDRTERVSRTFGHSSFAAETLKNLVFRVLPLHATRVLKRAQGRRRSGIEGTDTAPPMWATSKDHFVVQFRKAPVP